MPSYEKSKSSGLWSVRFRELRGETGKTVNKRLSGYKTKREAQYGYEDYITAQKQASEENKSPELESAKLLTFAELVEQYINYKRSRVKPTSFYDIEKRIRLRILPFFKDMNVEDITPITILAWQNSLSEYSYAYRKDLIMYLNSIYNYAENYLDIKNVAKKVEKPRNLEPKKEMQIWSAQEFGEVMKKVKHPGYAMLYRFLFLTGCRKGEALALTWADLDLNKGTAIITKSISNKVRDEGKWYSITTPKNAGSNRTVFLPPFFCDMLRTYQKEQELANEPPDFVFGGANPFPYITIDRRFHQAADAAGVKRIRIHDLRHSCASLLIHKGVSIVAVSRHLGHKSVKQTLDTYSHMMPDDQTMIIQSLSSVADQLAVDDINIGTKIGTKK